MLQCVFSTSGHTGFFPPQHVKMYFVLLKMVRWHPGHTEHRAHGDGFVSLTLSVCVATRRVASPSSGLWPVARGSCCVGPRSVSWMGIEHLTPMRASGWACGLRSSRLRAWVHAPCCLSSLLSQHCRPAPQGPASCGDAHSRSTCPGVPGGRAGSAGPEAMSQVCS